jgi:TonB-dependent receptor
MGVSLFAATASFGQGRTYNFDIPAESLSKAIKDFSATSGTQVVFDPAILRNQTGPALKGTYSSAAGLSALLKNTNLTFNTTADGVMVITAAGLAGGVQSNGADTASGKASEATAAASAASPAADVVPDNQEIVISGFRSSLQKSLNLKKEAIGVRDSIVAEDIGKFPEANVAEALQRIPGVYLTRDGQSNEGQRISIRGLGSDFSVTTVNGAPVRTTSSTNVGGSSRDFNYDVFASELFGRVDFYKTPLAELEEGGIGGVVDLQTPRPFDNPNRVIRYSASASYNSASKHLDPTGFVLYSNTWGDWGFLIGVAHSNSVNMKSGFEATGGYNSNAFANSSSSLKGPFTFTLDYLDPRANLGSYTQAQVDNAFLPRFYRYYGAQNTRQRDGLVSSVQFKHGKVDVSLDMLFSHLQDARDEFTFGLPIRNSATTASGRTTQPNGYPTHNGLVPINVSIDPATNLLTGTFGNTDYLGESFYYNDETKFGYASLNAKYQMTDSLRFTGQVSTSDSNAFYTNNKINSNIYGVTTTIDYTSNHVYPALSAQGLDFTNSANYRDFQAGFDWNREIDKERTAKFVADYDYRLPFNWTGHLKAGLSYVSTTKQKIKRNATSLGTAQIASIGLTGMQSHMQPFVPLDNLVIGDGYPHAWATFSRDFIEGTFNPVGKALTVDPDFSTSFTAEEQIKTWFIQSDFTGLVFDRELRINLGVRDSITTSLIDNYTKQTVGSVTSFLPHHVEGGYHNMLPSLSAAYNLNDKLVWRGSYGKTITRASLSIIAANTVIPNIFNPVATSGNPDLKPQISTNSDTGLEWYFSKGSLLSAGYFWKDLKDVTRSTTTTVPFSSLGLPDSALGALFIDPVTGKVDPNLAISLQTYYNADEVKIHGYELAYQQNFTFLPSPWNGLGALASFTHVDSTGYNWVTNAGKTLNVNLIPKYSYSLTAYYEKGPLGVRLTYNFKDRNIFDSSNTTNTGNDLQRWHAGSGVLDGNISYKLNSKIELRVDALNLGNTLNYDYFEDVSGKYGDGKKTRMDYAKYDGRTIKIGIRGKF